MKCFKQRYSLLLAKIWQYTNSLFLPSNKFKSNDIKTNSWFDITQSIYDEHINNYDAKLKKISKKSIKCEQIRIYPSSKQKDILISWMNSYIKMYNDTISLFKRYHTRHKIISLNWQKIRTYHLKDKKKKLIKTSRLTKYKKSNINAHILDYAIKQACASYKSCLTNLKNNNIKHFRLRHIKQSKRNKILIIEKNLISRSINNFCTSVFTKPLKCKNNFLLKNIKKDFTIHYDSLTSEFYILNPIEAHANRTKNKKNTISLDPGIRKFLVGFTNKKTIKICTNLKKTINKIFKKIDNVHKANKK